MRCAVPTKQKKDTVRGFYFIMEKKSDRIWNLVIIAGLVLLTGAGIRSLMKSAEPPAAVTVRVPVLSDSTEPDLQRIPEHTPSEQQTGAASEPPAQQSNYKTPDTNLNTADEAALRNVSGVGAVLAKRIVDYRTRIGGFTRRAQLLEITGIGENLAAQIMAQFTIPDELPPETTAAPVTNPPETASRHQTAERTVQQTEPAEPEPPQKRDLNEATEAELLEVPGMTPERAAAILDMRERLHGFKSLRELILCDHLTGSYITETIAQYFYVAEAETQPSLDSAAG